MDKNEIYIAVPSNDGETIFPKMLGMTACFYIYRLNHTKQSFSFIEKRENPYIDTRQHMKTLDVYELIKDCKKILSAHIGKKGIEKLKNKGVELYFDRGKIQPALVRILKSA